MEQITLDYLLSHAFEKNGLETEKTVRSSGMFSDAELSMLPPSDEDKMTELKIKMSDYVRTCGGYKNVYVNMNINEKTLKKTLLLNENRGIKREMLAKFVIGAKLSLEQANELFELHSYALDPKTTRIDAVVVHCIQKGYDINGFLDVCKQVNLDVTIVK